MTPNFFWDDFAHILRLSCFYFFELDPEFLKISFFEGTWKFFGRHAVNEYGLSDWDKSLFLDVEVKTFALLETQIIIFMTCYVYLILSTRCQETFPHIHVIVRQIFYVICQENEVLFEFVKMRLSESPEYSIVLPQLSCTVKMSPHNFQIILSWFPISKRVTRGIC